MSLASAFHQLSSLITAQKEAIAKEANDNDSKEYAMWCMAHHPSMDDTPP